MTYENITVVLLGIIALCEILRANALSKSYKEGYKDGVKDGSKLLIDITREGVKNLKTDKD